MKYLHQFFRKDNYAFGAFLGLVSPLVLVFIFRLIFSMLSGLVDLGAFSLEQHFLITLIGNLFFVRYYFAGVKMEKTGKAVLIVTLLLIIVYFVFK